MEDRWTAEEVAQKLHITLRTLYQWRVDGKGPRGVKVGRQLLFKPSDVEAWIDEQDEVSA
jgi:excisionase family DNA binding protein